MSVTYHRYEHGVIEVSRRLVEAHRGSSDGMSDETQAELVAWLQRRVREWMRSGRDQDASYDNAVLALADSALAEVVTAPADS